LTFGMFYGIALPAQFVPCAASGWRDTRLRLVVTLTVGIISKDTEVEEVNIMELN